MHGKPCIWRYAFRDTTSIFQRDLMFTNVGAIWLLSAIYSVTNWAMQGRTFMRTVIAVAVLLMLCADVRAQTLTECGKSDGYSYHFAGGLVSADKGGWIKDRIDSGRIILNYVNGEIDLLTKSAIETTASSVKQDGGKIFPRQTNNGLIALTVVYNADGLTEDYVFQLNDRGDGTVAHTVIRTASPINKMSLMTSQCRGPR